MTAFNKRTDHEEMFFVFTVDRTYRIAVDTVRRLGSGQESRSPLALPLIVEAGRPVRVHVGTLTGGKPQSLPDEVRIRFWPPAPADLGESWTCPCGRNTDSSGERHWEWNVQVPIDRDYDIADSVG